MSRKGLYFVTGSAAVAVLATVVGMVWWTRGRAEAYSGMASRFPDSTAVFVEVRHLGQWMQLPADVQVQPEPIKSQDPLLGVLGRVWAAERIRPEDLPVILKDQPFAVGLWRDGETWKGAGLLAVTPAVRQPLEEFLKGKLGQGAAAGEVSGIQLFAMDPPELPEGSDLQLHGTQSLVWGVGESWAVVASGIEEARQVLSSPARPLDTDPDFLDSAAHFPLEKGGWVFVRGSALASLAAKAGRCADQEPRPEEGAPAPDSSPAVPEPPAEGDAPCIGGGVGNLLSTLVPTGSVPCMAMWSSPPQSAEGLWDVRAWVGRDKDGKGLLKLFTEGGSRRPDLLGRVAKDGTLYAWVGGEDPAGLYKGFMDELARVATPDKVSSVRAAVGAAEGKLGVSFANDLLPTLGDEACMVLRQTAGEDGEKGPETLAVYLSLRDSRRLQSLLREKVGPSLGLVETPVQGATSWSWKPKEPGGEEPSLQLLVTADFLVITQDAGWALGSSPEGKAFKHLMAEEGKFALLVVADGEGWNVAGKPPVVVSGTREEDGVLFSASFSGKRPKMPFFEPSGEEGKGNETTPETEPKKAKKATA